MTNASTGEIEVTTHSDFQRIEGVQIPFRSVLMVADRKVHEVQMLQVRANLGVASWMFERSAAAYYPSLEGLKPASRGSVGADVDFKFPGDFGGIDFVLPGLSDQEKQEILLDLE